MYDIYTIITYLRYVCAHQVGGRPFPAETANGADVRDLALRAEVLPVNIHIT